MDQRKLHLQALAVEIGRRPGIRTWLCDPTGFKPMRLAVAHGDLTVWVTADLVEREWWYSWYQGETIGLVWDGTGTADVIERMVMYADV